MKSILLLLAVGASQLSAADLPFIEVDPSSTTAFREQGTGKPFVSVGLTYFDHETGWAPHIWQRFDETRVRDQLKLICDQGFNTIRVFITLQSFEQEAGRLSSEGRDKFRRLLYICRHCSIRVIPTGPELWEGAPAWYKGDRFADEQMLAAEESWWRQFASEFANEPAILAWDLANEPCIGWTSPAMRKRWNEWLTAKYQTRGAIAAAWNMPTDKLEPEGQISVPPAQPARDDRRLLDYQRFREYIGDQWTSRMAGAIRSVDRHHMISIGQIQWASPIALPGVQHYAGFDLDSNARLLDFTTIHFYPVVPPRPCDAPEGILANRVYLEALLADAAAAGKPVMLGEFGWYGGGGLKNAAGAWELPEKPIEHQAAWCDVLLQASRGRVCGWLNWAFADPPEAKDLSRWSGLWTQDLKLKPWGKTFGEFARANRQPLPPRPFDARPTFDREAALTDPAVGNEYRQRLFQAASSPHR